MYANKGEKVDYNRTRNEAYSARNSMELGGVLCVGCESYLWDVLAQACADHEGERRRLSEWFYRLSSARGGSMGSRLRADGKRASSRSRSRTPSKRCKRR